MKHVVLPVDQGSYLKAARVAAHAFGDDPLIKALLPGFPPDIRTERTTNFFVPYYRACCRIGRPVQVLEDNSVAGAACIWPPGIVPLPTRVIVQVVLECILRNRFRLDGLLGFFKWLSFVEKKHPQTPHYYLDFFGIDPLQQGRGLGSAILDHISCKADQEQIGYYLESTNPRNLSLYRRFGFQIIAEGDVVVPTWFLWRPPIEPIH